jgi:radical SAM-linked protein
VNKKWLALELKRALSEGTLSICGPTSCHGCAPFAKECVKGVVAETTDRPLSTALPILSTPAAAGPGCAARAEDAPPLLPAPPQGPATRGPEGPRYRYRFRFSKTGRVRFLGHLDLARTLMRALRRARLPLVYSQGFNPKPRVQFGPALPLGFQSRGEYFDLETSVRLDAEVILERVNAALPEGIRAEALREIAASVPSLGEAIRAARYRVEFEGPGDAADRVARFRERGPVTIVSDRKGRTATFALDRELLDLEAAGERAWRLTLAVRGDGASVRPEEVVREIFGGDAPPPLLTREELLVEHGDRWLDPILAAAAGVADVGSRAAV